MENDEDDVYEPLAGCLTVGELIKKLQAFDPNLPVMGAYFGWVRAGEYFDFFPKLSNLEDQNDSGDPARWGTGPLLLLTNA